MPIIPKTKDNALKLLAAADKLKLPRSAVKSTTEGFLVSDEVEKEFLGKSEPKKSTPSKAKGTTKADEKKEGKE